MDTAKVQYEILEAQWFTKAQLFQESRKQVRSRPQQKEIRLGFQTRMGFNSQALTAMKLKESAGRTKTVWDFQEYNVILFSFLIFPLDPLFFFFLHMKQFLTDEGRKCCHSSSTSLHLGYPGCKLFKQWTKSNYTKALHYFAAQPLPLGLLKRCHAAYGEDTSTKTSLDISQLQACPKQQKTYFSTNTNCRTISSGQLYCIL